MGTLFPGARKRVRSPFTVRDHTENPVLATTPTAARAAAQGHRHRPHYAPRPADPSREDIRQAKAQIVRHRQGMASAQRHIDFLEANLARLDSQQVVACVVPGYVDPTDRVARAKAELADGKVTVITREIAAKIRSGELPRPTMPAPLLHRVHDMKQRIVQLRTLVDHAAAHNDYLEADMGRLDPQHVVAATVAGYTDPPDICARAAAAADQA